MANDLERPRFTPALHKGCRFNRTKMWVKLRSMTWADIGPSPWDFGLIFALIRKIRVICGHLFWNRVVSPRPCASDKTLRGYNDLRVVLSFRLES